MQIPMKAVADVVLPKFKMAKMSGRSTLSTPEHDRWINHIQNSKTNTQTNQQMNKSFVVIQCTTLVPKQKFNIAITLT